MFYKDEERNEKMTQNGVIGPFHYSELALSSLCEIVGVKSRMCYDFLFYIPGYCLTFENEQVKKRWVWNWSTYYSSNSDLVTFLIHSSTFIPKKTAINPLGVLVTIRFVDTKPPSYSMKRKNGIRSRYSSKLKGSCFFAKSIEIINDRGKIPTTYWTVPQLREFIDLNCKTGNGLRNSNDNTNMGDFDGSFDTRNLMNDQCQKRRNQQNSKFIHQSKHFRITVGKNQQQEEELEIEKEQQQKQQQQQQQQQEQEREREKKNIYKNRDQKNYFKKKTKNNYNRNTTQNYNDHIQQIVINQTSTLKNAKILNRKRKHKAFVRLPTMKSQSSSNSSSNSDYENNFNSSYPSLQPTNISKSTRSYPNSNSISNSKSESEFHLQKGKKKKYQNFTNKKKTKKQKGRIRKAKIKRKAKQTEIKTNKPQMTSSVSLPNLIFLQQNGTDILNGKEKSKNISKNNKLGDYDDDEDDDQFYNSEPETQDDNLDTQNNFDSFLKNSKSFIKKKSTSTTNPNQQQLDHFRRKKSILLSIWEKCGSKKFLQTDFHSSNENVLDVNLFTDLTISNKKNNKNTNIQENSFSSQTVLYSLSNEPCLSYSLDYIGDFGFQNKDQTYYKFRSQVLYLETAEKRFELSFQQNGLFRFAQVLNPETYHYNSILHPINIPIENTGIIIIKVNLFWGQIKWSTNCILFGDFMLEPIKFFWCKKKQTTKSNKNKN
ncbi:hypothetical protein M0812_14401 [Anaeramoeba flamelloides]|uniref:Uncharacterized protein n=1 Tax=Anaeramoeba flamelloides TaxID=1746091 RepID=A0AAV7ZKC7_9EUKA|nr:hypothetical protein M0812_14401 [Anaeramoeba flamelloides]